ncbi:MAG: VCBS repeat-containing protein [Bryobacteraceae bacterium]
MNNLNQVTGDFNPGTGVTYGFVTTSTGIYTQFTCPNGADTHPAAINNFGTIVGTCGVPVISQGFIRDASGTFTLISYPGASYTEATGVNDSGQVTGYYAIPSGTTSKLHGFIRDPGGALSSFDVPSASDTVPVAVNNAGQITGYYGSAFTSVFLRAADGSISTFSAPGIPAALDNAGRVFGNSTPGIANWVRDVNGSVMPLVITLSHRTVLAAVNDSGAMTGQDWDTAAGFLSLPCVSASLNAMSRTHGPGNEKGQVTVTAPQGCSWSTASYADWIIHPSGVFSGPQEVTSSYVVLPNNSGATRIGNLNIAGQIFTVTQAAGSCAYALSGPHDLPPTGGSGMIAISTTPECGWTALPVQLQGFGGAWDPIPWLTVSPESGFGSGTTSFVADKCSGCSGTILIGSDSFLVDTPAFSSQIYVQDDASRSVKAWYMNGISQVGTSVLSGAEPGWHLAATTDFNRDGVRDLIWQSDTSGLATVWFMGGAGDSELLSWAWLGDGSADWRVVAAYDFDRNGIPDLVWQNQITGEATVWYMATAKGLPQMVQWTYLSGPGGLAHRGHRRIAAGV